jgi:hypothetical protein
MEHPQGCQARRPAGRAVNQVRVRDQHANREKIDAGRVAAWAGQGGDKGKLDWIVGDAEDNRLGGFLHDQDVRLICVASKDGITTDEGLEVWAGLARVARHLSVGVTRRSAVLCVGAISTRSRCSVGTLGFP